MRILQSRMKYLRMTEVFSAFCLPVVFWWYWQRADEPVAWGMRGAALALVSYILLQGAMYWHLKLHSFSRHQRLPGYFPLLYTFFKYSNLCAAAALLAIVLVVDRASASRSDLAWSAGLLAFAVLEQVNYYHYQLMYDTRAALDGLRRHGRLRTAALALDLKKRHPTD